MKKLPLLLLVVIAATAAVLYGSSRNGSSAPAARARESTVTLERRDFSRGIRLTGTVEAVESTTVSTPRLSGPSSNSLVITRLVSPGTRIQPGDLLVEFDRQVQLQTALDRRAELNDLDQQIRRREAEEAANRARDDSDIQVAQSGLERAKLEMRKNDLVPPIQAEKNVQALEQAEARLKQLRLTYDLKRKAAAADLEILRIRRAKAENAMKQAEANAQRMEIRSPIAGLAVLRTVWKTNNMAEVQEGEEVRPGVPVVDIVNPERMQVRARVNQADISDLAVGQRVRVGLDAYPSLTFEGRVAQLSPLAVASSLSPKVRTFVAIVAVEGSHPNLMPDLTAWLDVELEHVPGTLVVPRDAVRRDGERHVVEVRRGDRFQAQEVTLGAANRHEVVVAGGLEPGAVVRRNITQGSAQ
jgi:multidrug efflux pump subunit AcrA (membrane-fusion protein)